MKASAVNPNAYFKKTYPGSPPKVSDYFGEAAWLLLVVYQANTYECPTVVFNGTECIDLAKLAGFLELLPPAMILPYIGQQAIGQTSVSGRSEVYTWEWELRPLTSGQTSGN